MIMSTSESVIINGTMAAAMLDFAANGSTIMLVAGGDHDQDLVDNMTAFFGPKRDPLYVVIPVTIVYLLIFITGIVGNISTCIVISKNKSMHTATNYYLFSLAISDFLLLISGVPQEIYFIWSKYPYIFGELFCVIRGIAAETSANATVLTITAFTVERYVAICHPFLSHTMSKLSRAIRYIFAIWIVAIVSAIPQALQFGVTNQGGVDQCVVKRIIIQHSFELSTFVFFFAPMTLITVLYALIGLKLRSSALMQRDGTLQKRNNNCPHARQQGTSQGTRRVLKMLVAVVVAFFICWAPFHAQRLVYIYGTKDHQPTDPLILKLFVVTTYISGILYYMSTCINPLLYNIMSNKFRQAFKETLAHCCHVTRKSRGGKERSYRILSRRELRPASNKESSEFSGNSIKDESLYSSTTQKQTFDSVGLSRGHSVKQQQRSSAVLGDCHEVPRSAGSHQQLARLDLYTEQQQLRLNIFPPKDVVLGRSRSSSENLSKISIQLNNFAPVSEHHHHLHHHHHHHHHSRPAEVLTTAESILDENLNQSTTKSGTGLVTTTTTTTNVDVVTSGSGRAQSEIKIFIKHKKCQNRNRLKFWRFFSPKWSTTRRRRNGNGTRRPPHPSTPAAAVHFYSPVLGPAEMDSLQQSRQPLCGGEVINVESIASEAASVSHRLPTDGGGVDDDDLEAYMQEIKQRESRQCNVVP